MAIIFNPNKKIFTLQTAHTTYQMQVDRLGYLLHLYYGAKSTGDIRLIHCHRSIRLLEQVISEILRLILKTNRVLRVLSFFIRVMKSETENTL